MPLGLTTLIKGVGSNPNMPSPFRNKLVLKAESAEISKE